MSTLPSRREVFLEAIDELSGAYRALGDAADWLRSDRRPGGTVPVAEAEERFEMFDAIGEAKAAINRAKAAANRALGES